MVNQINRKEIRVKKHERQRNRFMGTPECPRLTVFRSDKHIYAQIIDDVARKTLCQASTIKNKELKHTNDIEAAKYVGKTIGEAATKLGISQVVFDRSGYLYHGKVKAVADSAREAGLKF
ncbi:MAG: 50S ribosomal protein L18 [Lachnospiraceae bacterium]|nr:50S ribosomal protein L18 [Lachnospiraceae bacterium]MBR1844726.1 50S ribosomal protein L18 [Lachnospiraceae bacterium]